MDPLKKKVQSALNNFHNQVANNVIVKIGQSPIGHGLVNTQNFLEGNKPIQIPQLNKSAGNMQIGKIPLTNTPVTLGQAWNLGGSFVNSALNLGYGTATDIGTNIGKTISGQPLKQYKDLKSPFVKAAYQASNIIQPQNVTGYNPNIKPQEILGNVGDIGTGLLSVYGGGKVFGMGKNAVRGLGQPIKQAAVKGFIQTGKIAGAYGISSGLSEGRNKSLMGQFAEAGKQGAINTVLGGLLGSGISTSGALVGKAKGLTKYSDEALNELGGLSRTIVRNPKTGQFAPSKLVKPKGLTRAQWEVQKQVNKILDRNPYDYITDSHVKQAFRIESNKKGAGLSVRDLSVERTNGLDRQGNPISTSGQVDSGASPKIKQGVDRTSQKSAFDTNIPQGAQAGLSDTGKTADEARQSITNAVSTNPNHLTFGKIIVPENLQRQGIGSAATLEEISKAYQNGAKTIYYDATTDAGKGLLNKLIRDGYITKHPKFENTFTINTKIKDVGTPFTDIYNQSRVAQQPISDVKGLGKDLKLNQVQAESPQKISQSIKAKSTSDPFSPQVSDQAISGGIQSQPVQQQPGLPQLQANQSDTLPNIIAQDTRKALTGSNIKERGFVTHLKASDKTPQPVKDIVNGSYVQKSGAQLRADAKALIKADISTAEKIAVNPRNDVDVQMGNELLNHYYATGQLEKARILSEGMANSGTELGRAVQAFSNYDKTTPAGALRFAQSKVNEYNKLNPNQKLNITDAQVKSIFDRAHKIQDMPEGEARNIAANDLMNEVNNLIPSSIWDKAITVWKAGLLTSLRTHERNLLGNTIHGAAETIKDIPASMADIAMSAKTGQRTKTFTLKGMGSGTREGLQAGKNIITKGYDPTEAISKYDVKHITWGNNRVEQALKVYTNAIFRTLGAEDKPFWYSSYNRSLFDQATAIARNQNKAGDAKFINELVSKATPEMKGLAVKDANVTTFHDTNQLTEVAHKMQGFKVAGAPVGQVIAPFTGVPSSIATQIVSYSPVGLVKGIFNSGRVISGSQIPNLQRIASQEIGRGVIGTGLIGIGAYLASKGLLTGQPKDPQEADQWQLEGKQANSVLINGKWRSIGSIGPENLVILAGAKAQEEMSKPDGSLVNAGANIGKDFLGQTFLQGVQGPLNAVSDPNRYAQSYVGGQAASVIPNIIKDTAKALDPYQRENNKVAFNPAKGQFGINDYITNSIPGLRNKNLVKRDNLGNPIKQEPSGLAAYVDLFNSKTPIHNDVVDELARLNNAGNNATPSKLKKDQTISGVKMTLTPEQLNVLEAQTGPQVTQAISSLIKDPAYQALPDEDKAKAIDSVVSAARKQTRAGVDINSSNQITPTQNTQTTTKSTSGLGSYTLIDPETGSVKTIDLSKSIEYPTLTGNSELDKKLVSTYKTELTTRANNIVKLYKAGKIDAKTAEVELAKITSSKNKSGTGKARKLTIAKISSKKAPALKLKKAPKLKFKKVAKAKKAPQLKVKAYKVPKKPKLA